MVRAFAGRWGGVGVSFYADAIVAVMVRKMAKVRPLLADVLVRGADLPQSCIQTVVACDVVAVEEFEWNEDLRVVGRMFDDCDSHPPGTSHSHPCQESKMSIRSFPIASAPSWSFGSMSRMM